ncbi:MAG: thioredoxin family protein [Bacteroidetes bacterium]|nr:thioredoxin family protein [Bacteroidota bacterium]
MNKRFTMRLIASTSLLLLCLISAVHAQFGPAGSGGQVSWRTEILPASGYQVGDVITIHFYATVKPEWHIYSVKKYPEGKIGPLPSTFELFKESKGVVVAGGLQETGTPTKEYDDIFEVDTYHFSQSAHYFQQLKITDPQARIVGKLRAQACKEGVCMQVDTEIDKPISAAAPADGEKKNKPGPQEKVQEQTPGTSQDAINGHTQHTGEAAGARPLQARPSNLVAGQPQATGLWLFWVCFLAGLVALVTPCVFPLIPMTVSYFTKQARSRRQGLRDAGIYVLSIIGIFLLAGISLAAIFGPTVFYDIATNGYVNLIFFAIIFLFALSFLGWFDITLPSSWSTRADKASMKSSGLAGIFFMALTLVIASFSCTGPILALVFSYAGTGDFSQAVVGMLGFSLGFGLPFGLFALFPGLLSSLPRSGGWMNAVKVTLGFIELMLCMKFFSQADQLWHWELLDREVFIAIWVVLAFALGVYLMGGYRLPHDHQKLDKVPVPRLLVALAAFGFGATLIPGLWGAPLENLSGILPPQNREVGVKISDFYAANYSQGSAPAGSSPVCEVPRKGAAKHAKNAPPGFCMFYDLEEGLAYAQEVNKPVFLDFTGWTCANCRLMENKVWQDPRIKKLLNEEFVMISLYVDEREELPEPLTTPEGKKLRTEGDKWLDFQQRKYKLNAQPWYAITDGQLTDLVPPMGYDTDKDAYLAFLQKGLEAYKQSHK